MRGKFSLIVPTSLQHLLDRTFGLRQLMCIAGAQHHIRVRPVLWIEERIAPDRDRRLALAISPSCIPMSPSRASAYRLYRVPEILTL